MNYQEQFPTIWDAPLKPATQTVAKPSVSKGVNKPQITPLKEAFLTIWDNAKSKTAS